MAKRGEKLDPKTKSEIIRLSTQGFGSQRIARDLGLHRSTVRGVLEGEAEAKVVASPSFSKHSSEVSNLLRHILSNKELLDSSLAHFKQQFPEFAHLNTWQDITEEDISRGIFAKIELMADSQILHFCKRCPVCQAIERHLRKGA